MTFKLARSFLREFAVRAFIVALTVAALLPQGFMPTAGALSSGSLIVLCTGSGAMPGFVDEHGKPSKVPPSDDRSACPFAGAVATAIAATAPALAYAPTFHFVVPAAPLAPSAFAAARYRPQSSRGPPVLV